MRITFFEPRPALRPFVQSLWAVESDSGLPVSEGSLVAPNGRPKLIVNCRNSLTTVVDGHARESRDHELYLVGLRDIPVSLHTRPGKTRFIGVEFRPHGAYGLLGIPMNELTNRLLPALDLVTAWERSIPEIIADHEEVGTTVSFLQDLLVRRANADTPASPVVDYCVHAIERSAGLVTIRELETETGYSRRYIEMLFRRHVGVSPKVLAGISRFQKFYRQWARGLPYEELARELHAHYYDQSHFDRDFRRMTGSPPRRFVAEARNEFGRSLALR